MPEEQAEVLARSQAMLIGKASDEAGFERTGGAIETRCEGNGVALARASRVNGGRHCHRGRRAGETPKKTKRVFFFKVYLSRIFTARWTFFFF